MALDPDAQADQPSRLWTAMSFGEPLPVRVTRAILLARLANFLGGHAAVRAEVAAAVVEMINDRSSPVVPAQSNGGAGEILPLGTLFYELSERVELRAKERMALTARAELRRSHMREPRSLGSPPVAPASPG